MLIIILQDIVHLMNSVITTLKWCGPVQIKLGLESLTIVLARCFVPHMLSCVSPRKVSFQPLQATMLELPNGLATINLGNVPGEYIDNVRPPQDGGGCPHNKIWNECGNSCNDSYCVCDDTCGDLVCTMACEPRCECPEGMVPSPANADLCVSPAEVCSDMITTPSPPTTVAPTPIWTTIWTTDVSKKITATNQHQSHVHQTNIGLNATIAPKWIVNGAWLVLEAALRAATVVSRKTNVFVTMVMLVIHLVSKNYIGKVRW